MALPSLPTDSIYKLIAVFGSILVFYGIYNTYNLKNDLEYLNLEKNRLQGENRLNLARVQTEVINASRLCRKICRTLGVPDSCCVYDISENSFNSPNIIDEFNKATLKNVANDDFFHDKIYVNDIESKNKIFSYKDSIEFPIYNGLAKTEISDFRRKFDHHYENWLKYNYARQEAVFDLEHQLHLINIHGKNLSYQKILNRIIYSIGLLLAILGFYLWYHKIQKYDDIRTKNLEAK